MMESRLFNKDQFILAQKFSLNLSDLLESTFRALEAGDTLLAFKTADRACRLTEKPDINALLVKISPNISTPSDLIEQDYEVL